MKKLVVVMMLVSTLAFSQQRNFELSATSGSANQSVFVGIGNSASYGFDSALGETELPPLPPSGVFDVRMVNDSLCNGSWKDYRNGNYSTTSTVVHQLNFQRDGSNGFSFSYNLPSTISMRIQDVVTGSIIDTVVNGSGTYTVANSGIVSLKLSVNYSNQLLADVNDDGSVDMGDLLAVYNIANSFGYNIRCDLNYDGYVDNTDINIVYSNM